MALQLRKLLKKQKQGARELQAAAAREAFWRSSAHAAEQALDEVIPSTAVLPSNAQLYKVKADHGLPLQDVRETFWRSIVNTADQAHHKVTAHTRTSLF